MTRRFSTWLENRTFMRLREVLDAADKALPMEAQRAITEFVGHGPMARTKGGPPGGIMWEDLLEDAFSPKPSYNGMRVREQLVQAFEPVRNELRNILGDPVRLYRHQRPVRGKGHRNILSWTLNKEFAQYSQGPDLTKYYAVVDADGWQIKELGNKQRAEQLAAAINAAGGITHALHLQWRIEEDEIDLPVRAVPDPSENHPDFGAILDEWVPLDKVVWATDRANQMEFMVRNTT